MMRAANRGKGTHTLIEQYIKGETPSIRRVLPLGLFRLIKPYVDQVDNIHFKTANKERQESWIENYFMQTTAYAQMYKETFGKEIEQIVILLASEDGSVQTFVKNPKDYMEPLKQCISDFYKYYEELNKDKIKQE